MVNPLNIILPFLHSKPKAEKEAAKIRADDMIKHYQETEEFVSVLRRYMDMPEDDLTGRIWSLAVRLSNATALDQGEAASCIREWIISRINQKKSVDDAVRETFSYVTDTYLTRPLGVFDKRQEVHFEDGEAK